MAIVYTEPSSATLAGARDLNRASRPAAQEDLGYKIEVLISAVNALNSAVSQIHIALGSAATSMAGTSLFSAFSAYTGGTSPGTVSTFATMSNFRA